MKTNPEIRKLECIIKFVVIAMTVLNKIIYIWNILICISNRTQSILLFM